MTPIFFNNQDEFHEWLEKNHQAETELWVGYYKVETSKPSLTWSQSVDLLKTDTQAPVSFLENKDYRNDQVQNNSSNRPGYQNTGAC